MAKKSTPVSRKGKAVVEKEEEYGVESVAEEGKGIDFFYLMAGGAVLTGAAMIFFIIFHYGLHII